MALRDVPQTINVVPAAVIRDQNAMSIQDIMKNIPGVGLSTGDGQRDQVFIRGFTAIGDQFVDGFRDDALYFRDLSNVERLEVIKGPAAVLYGRGSSGGLVNRITKKPGIDITDVALSLTNMAGRRGESTWAGWARRWTGVSRARANCRTATATSNSSTARRWRHPWPSACRARRNCCCRATTWKTAA